MATRFLLKSFSYFTFLNISKNFWSCNCWRHQQADRDDILEISSRVHWSGTDLSLVYYFKLLKHYVIAFKRDYVIIFSLDYTCDVICCCANMMMTSASLEVKEKYLNISNSFCFRHTYVTALLWRHAQWSVTAFVFFHFFFSHLQFLNFLFFNRWK